MDININFPNQKMLDAFLTAFKKLGYTSKDFIVIDNTFCFKYIKPRTKKVWTRTWLTDSIRQYFNCKNVELYNKYLDDLIDDNKIDDSKINTNKKIIILNDFIPRLLRNVPENQEISDKINKKIFSEKEQNVALIERDPHPESRSNKS